MERDDRNVEIVRCPGSFRVEVTERLRLRERVVYFVSGIAIGLAASAVMLGVIQFWR